MGIELEVHTLRQDRVEMLRQSLCAHVATSLQSEKLSIADIDEAVDRVVDRLGKYQYHKFSFKSLYFVISGSFAME